jgi:hypothetical protein
LCGAAVPAAGTRAHPPKTQGGTHSLFAIGVWSESTDPFIKNRRCVMKRRTVAKLRYVLISLLLLFGCMRDRITSPKPSASGLRLSSILQDGVDIGVWFFYENGNLSAIEDKQEEPGDNRNSFIYQADRPVRLELTGRIYGSGLLLLYEYSPDGLVNKLVCMNGEFHQFDVRIFRDSAGRIICVDHVLPDGSSWQRYELAYDANGNVMEERRFSSGRLNWIIIREFDDKVNPTYPFREILMHYPVFFSRNNPTRISSPLQDGIQTTDVSTCTYTYDLNGYPLTRKTITTSGKNQPLEISSTYHYDVIIPVTDP